jgi:outer membrane protein assembly factor BamB
MTLTSPLFRLSCVALLALVAACSKDKNVDPPAELVDFKQTVKVDRLWSASLPGDEPVLRLGLAPAASGEVVYAASHGGDVAAFKLADGRQVWRSRTSAALSGGPAVGSGLVVVGSSDGEVIALNEADGVERWRVRVRGEVLSAPAIAEEAVVVRTGDGRLLGLSPADGSELWREQQAVPRLTLRGAATPAVAGNVAVCGFDNGRVLAVAAGEGDILWDALVTPARGRTELERLVDIDSAVRIDGADVFVAGFQGRVAMLAIDTGQVWWSREISSHRGLDFDAEQVFVASSDGDLVALRRRTGIELWRQDAFKRRGLSAPASIGPHVVVADFEGFLHWLDKADGSQVARISAGARVSNAPVVVGDVLVVLDDKGRISAFRAKAPPAAPAETAPAAGSGS